MILQIKTRIKKERPTLGSTGSGFFVSKLSHILNDEHVVRQCESVAVRDNGNKRVKASTVRQFLTSAGLPTKWSNRTKRKSTKELAQIAKNQTVMVVCNP